MDNRIKPGRPNQAPTVAPPGKKWCNYGEHFAFLVEFTENDSYCRDCRREYNHQAYLERKKKRVKADILKYNVEIRCDCGFVMIVPESGEWICPRCGQEWNAVLQAKVEHDE